MHRYSFPSQPAAQPEAVITDHARYRFTVLGDGLLRYEWSANGVFEDRASTLAVNRHFGPPTYRCKNEAGHLEIITSRFHLTYDKKRFSPGGLSAVVRARAGYNGGTWRYGEDCADFGGTARTLDEADGRIPLGPGVASRRGFAVLDDSKSMLFDKHGWITSRPEGNDYIDGYLFAYGHDYKDAVKALYSLSGSQPLLPRWALGNWWSRYYSYRADEYLALMDRFRENQIPLSVAVLDMGWHLTDDPRIGECGASGWTGYTWNRDLFPDPAGFLAELHRRKLRTSLNDHPADGVQRFEEAYEKMAKALGRDVLSKDPIEFDATNKAFLDAYFDVLLGDLEVQGVDLWWVDWQQGEHSRISGIDPLWVLNHFHFLNSTGSHSKKRPLTFSRYAGPGSHRYPVGFSGDTVVTWDSLHFQPEFTATASNIGYGWWSHDIGGHMHGIKDDELLVRWVQLGAFSPILRLHSEKNIWLVKEPWNQSMEAEQVLMETLRFRHRLIPYLYSMNVRSAVDNEPLIQPMYWAYPTKPEAENARNQFFFGSELMVAPLTTPGDPKLRLASTRVWFPPSGRHVDIFTGIVYDSDREMWIARRISEYPVFAREGSIIPLDASPVLENGGDATNSFEILLVVGADGKFEIVEDDGKGCQPAEIDFSRTRLTYNRRVLRLLGYFESRPIQVSVNNKDIIVQNERKHNGTVVDIGTLPRDSKILVRLGGPNPVLSQINPNDRIREVLRNAQMSNDLKEIVWSAVQKHVPGTVKVSQLQALDLEPNLLRALLEYLLADSRVSSCFASRDASSRVHVN